MRIAELVAEGISLPEAVGTAGEIAWAGRRMLEIVARGRGPLVAVPDDIHWAKPALLDLVEHVTVITKDILLLVI